MRVHLALALCIATSCVSCGDSERDSTERPEPGARPDEPRPGWVPSPAPEDSSEVCADVASARACWTSAGPRGARRPRPPFEAPGGWRCVGVGRARECTARRWLASAMECGETDCQQRHPYLPDHGQWECMEEAGLAICRSVGDAAGLPPTERNPGWFCGPRRSAPAETLCVDPAPDRPVSGATSYRCRFDHESGERRRCVPETEARIGDACDSEEECPAGSLCAEGACVPRSLTPECWIDDDCAEARCLLAHCEVER